MNEEDHAGVWMAGVAILIVGITVCFAGFERSRETSQQNSCIGNLRQIDAAKDQWALEKGYTSGTPADRTEVGMYMKGGFPQCSAGGIYTYHPVSTDPECSYIRREHSLP